MREIEAQTCEILHPSIQWCFLNVPDLFAYFIWPICHLSPLTNTHTTTCRNKPVRSCMCVCWGLKGVITLFILRPSVWPSQRGSFRPATVGHWLARPSNIWIAWLAASRFYAGAERDRAMEHAHTDGQLQEHRSCYHRQIQADSFFTSHPVAIHSRTLWFKYIWRGGGGGVLL